MIEIGFLKILNYIQLSEIKEGDIVTVKLFYIRATGELSNCIQKEYLISKQDFNHLLDYNLCHSISFNNNFSEFIQLLLIAHRIDNIKKIEYPTYFIQKIVIEISTYNLKFIQNPCKKIQIEAINKNPWSIGNIYNPSLEACQNALYLSRFVINVIRDNSHSIDCYDQVLEFYNFSYRV